MEKQKEEKKENKIFKTPCYKCKGKDWDLKTKTELPYRMVQLKKDKKLLKEFKEWIKESEKIYHNPKTIKRKLINACPNCGGDLIVCCKDYVDFYEEPKENKKDKEE